MAKKVYEEEKIRAIANKIREKTGSNLTYKTSEMPQGIEDVYEAGKANGGGYDEGYAAGQQDHNKMLWESMQNDSQWWNCFSGHYWNDTTFNPTIDLIVPYTHGLFYHSHITDLKGILDRNGVKLDFSKATRLSSIFEGSTITRAPILDCRSCTTFSNFLYNAPYLKYIEKIILKDDGSQSWSTLGFNMLNKLEEVTFEGVIGCDMNISGSKNLTHDSLMSIINALKNFIERKTLTYSEATDSVSGLPPSYDYKVTDFNVLSATLDGTTLTCDCTHLVGDVLWEGVTFVANGVNISKEDVPYIKTIRKDIVSYNEETHIFDTDIVITTEKVTGSKTLTLGATNLDKLTDEEKAMATNKGWILA